MKNPRALESFFLFSPIDPLTVSFARNNNRGLRLPPGGSVRLSLIVAMAIVFTTSTAACSAGRSDTASDEHLDSRQNPDAAAVRSSCDEYSEGASRLPTRPRNSDPRYRDQAEQKARARAFAVKLLKSNAGVRPGLEQLCSNLK